MLIFPIQEKEGLSFCCDFYFSGWVFGWEKFDFKDFQI
jgi:hypothetical protein